MGVFERLIFHLLGIRQQKACSEKFSAFKKRRISRSGVTVIKLSALHEYCPRQFVIGNDKL